jgi:GNAT superfamily N-acetyltransferase
MRYDLQYHEDVELLDGTRVQLRLVRPEDKALLLDGFNRLSPESRYRRFFTPKTSLSTRELEYLTECDNTNHLAIGALLDGHGVGVARFIRCEDDRDVAEAAIAVVDAIHGKGLGRILLERLAGAARERGVTHFRCDVLEANERMRALLDEIAPSARKRSDGSVITVEYALPAEEPHFKDSALYRFLAQVARGAFGVGRR